jgi:hypothetical protein
VLAAVACLIAPGPFADPGQLGHDLGDDVGFEKIMLEQRDKVVTAFHSIVS